MKMAWIENDRIRDICQGEPVETYHPDIAKFYNTQVPDDAVNGDGWVNGQVIKPQPLPPSAPVARTWTIADIRKGLTLAERVKWDNDKTDNIKTAKIEMSEPQELAHTTEILEFLVSVEDISAESMERILS